MRTLKEALINKNNRDWATTKKTLWIIVPDGENPIEKDNIYDCFINRSSNGYWMYVFTSEQVKNVFDDHPKWYGVIVFSYNGDLFQKELIEAIEKTKYKEEDNFIPGSKLVTRKEMLKAVK
jgi:hypothetical protein